MLNQRALRGAGVLLAGVLGAAGCGGSDGSGLFGSSAGAAGTSDHGGSAGTATRPGAGTSGATAAGGGSATGGGAGGSGLAGSGASGPGKAGSSAGGGEVSFGAGGTSGATGGTSATGGTGSATGGTGGSGGTGDPACSAAAQLVYVFASDSTIWSFDPPTKQFTQVATADCPDDGLQANSMAIDRNLVAWLNYVDSDGGGDGQIFTFDLKTKSGCQATSISLPDGFGQVGMGFSTDTDGGTTETLYIDGIGGGGLAKIDMTSMSVVPIGSFGNDNKLSQQSAELTGTGDARLFGYFTTDPIRVAQIDTGSANILSDVPLKGIHPPDDWAFSFWGGDFYLYAASDGNDSSVIHYSPATGAVDATYVSDVGFTIIGAGVSTCAPTRAM